VEDKQTLIQIVVYYGTCYPELLSVQDLVWQRCLSPVLSHSVAFAVNPSQEVVKRLSSNGKPAGAVTAILPVDAARVPGMITDLLLDLQPDLCLMLGQANGYAALSVERVAINLCDFRIPDNAGMQPIDEPIVQDGPAAYFSTAPVRAVVDAIRAAGIPANLSLSAGAYLCNMVYYVALHVCATHRLPTRCLFITCRRFRRSQAPIRAPVQRWRWRRCVLACMLHSLPVGRCDQRVDIAWRFPVNCSPFTDGMTLAACSIKEDAADVAAVISKRGQR
jgi:pyroglutamyl-peptidase